jgi:hypothetical protein
MHKFLLRAWLAAAVHEAHEPSGVRTWSASTSIGLSFGAFSNSTRYRGTAGYLDLRPGDFLAWARSLAATDLTAGGVLLDASSLPALDASFLLVDTALPP